MMFPQAQLGEHVDVVGGFAFKSEAFAEKGVPVIRISDIQEGTVSVSKAAKIPVLNIGKGARFTVESGDILIAMSGATTGKIGLAPQNLTGCVLQNQRVGNFKIKNPEKILKAYLRHFVCSAIYQKQVYILMAGAAQPNISSSQLESITVPVPPLPVQRRIAAILDQADALRAKRREALAQLDKLTQSIFIEMIGDPVSNPQNWVVKPLIECAVKIQIGPFGTQLHEEDYIDGGIPLINPTHLRGGVIRPDLSLTVSEEKYTELSNYYLFNGDLIMGRRGEMGRCAVITQREHGWLCGTGSLFVRPKTEVIHPIYLGVVISSPSMRRFLENVAQGVTMANLNKAIVGGLPIAVPPMAKQLAFVSQLNATHAIKKHSLDSLDELDTLFASFQHRAFRGDL